MESWGTESNQINLNTQSQREKKVRRRRCWTEEEKTYVTEGTHSKKESWIKKKVAGLICSKCTYLFIF